MWFYGKSQSYFSQVSAWFLDRVSSFSTLPETTVSTSCCGSNLIWAQDRLHSFKLLLRFNKLFILSKLERHNASVSNEHVDAGTVPFLT